MPTNTDGGGSGGDSNRINVTVPTFNPSAEQLRGFTRISYSEQNSDTGAAAEMSLILNKYYLSGHTDGDANGLYSYLYGNEWWRNSASVMDGTWGNCRNPSDDQMQRIRAVLQGARTLPLYVDEHDFRGDVSYIENGNGTDVYDNGSYVQHRTVIHNKQGSTYIFFCFPTPESDPFGYTKESNREKFGDGVPAGGTTVGSSAGGAALGGSVSGGLNLSGLEFSSGRKYERETARVEEGGNPELKTFYRVNMSGAQFIRQVLAPYCRSKSTGQGAYRLWFKDETSPDGAPGVKLFFKPDQYSNIQNPLSDDLLEGIDKTYEFTFGTGPESSVISFNPNYSGMVTSVTGGYEVEATTTDAITNDIMQVRYGKGSDEKRPSTGDETFDGLQGTYRIGGSSYSVEDIQNRAANLWYNMAPYGYTADMTVMGDPMISVQSLCSVTVLTPSGIPHHSSGAYLIYHVTDSISGGTFETSMNMVRNAIDIGTDDAGGITISLGSRDTIYVGEAGSLMSGTYNDVLGTGGGTAANSDSADASASSGNGTVSPQAANSVIQTAVDWAIGIANDDSHGYYYGARGPVDYDCSGLVTSAYVQAGVLDSTPSTHTMKSVMVPKGFVEHLEVLNDCTNAQVGDVYINEGVHTAMYIGNGQIVHAAGSENKAAGNWKYGNPGDQNQKEILVADWYYGNWTTVLRYGS